MEQTLALLAGSEVTAAIAPDVVKLLVSTFQDLRSGRTAEGTIGYEVML